MKIKDISWNIPNILSTYRLLSMPFIVVLIFLNYETAFIAFFVFNQLTDILDGFIARKFNMTTKEGAILDSLADLGSYIIAVCGIIQFHSELFEQPYVFWLIAFVFFYCLTILVQ